MQTIDRMISHIVRNGEHVVAVGPAHAASKSAHSDGDEEDKGRAEKRARKEELSRMPEKRRAPKAQQEAEEGKRERPRERSPRKPADATDRARAVEASMHLNEDGGFAVAEGFRQY